TVHQQNLIGLNGRAFGAHLLSQPLAQRQISFSRGVLQCSPPLLAQYLVERALHFLDRKADWSGQTARKGNNLGSRRDLENFTNCGATQFLGTLGKGKRLREGIHDSEKS